MCVCARAGMCMCVCEGVSVCLCVCLEYFCARARVWLCVYAHNIENGSMRARVVGWKQLLQMLKLHMKRKLL